MAQQQQFETQGGATGYETRAESGQGIGGQQPGGMSQQGMSQQSGQTFESSLSGPMRLALHDFVQSLNACEWCADQCIGMGPEMAECVRLCRDVADLATMNVQLMGRDSIFGPEAAQLFAEAAEECAMECAQHPHSHCQECASVLRQAVDSTRSMLSSFQQGGGTGGPSQGGMSQQSVGGQGGRAGQQGGIETSQQQFGQGGPGQQF